jgi:ribonuclease D
MGFILQAIKARPSSLFDVQVAAGLVDHDYPAGYASIVRRFLNLPTNKGETRTDWRQRPLTPAQLEYALDDVRHLEKLWRKLEDKLTSSGRTAWMQDEMQSWQAEVEESFIRKRWRRVSGLSGLSRRELAMARERLEGHEEDQRRLQSQVEGSQRDEAELQQSLALFIFP